MDMKVNALSASAPVEAPAQVNQSDGTFKFTLASHIQEADLQARLNTLMEEITMQGDKLAKKRDIRDMKNAKFEISDIEYQSEGKSYSLITVKKIIEQYYN